MTVSKKLVKISMTDLTDASHKLESLIELLQLGAGLNLKGHIDRPSANGVSRPEIVVELNGPDTPLLINRNGELLHAIEHVAAKILGLESEEHDRIAFDADNFKKKRDSELHSLAEAAILQVRKTAIPYVFAPMMSRERRLLHLALASSGLHSASIGERFHRSVVLYPEGVTPPSQ